MRMLTNCGEGDFLMRSVLMVRVLMMSLVMCLAMTSVSFAEVKLGIVDSLVIMSESDFAKHFRDQREAKYGAEKRKLEAEAKELQKKGEALQKKPTEKKQVEFVKLKRKFDEKQYTFAHKIEQEELKFRQEMMTISFKAAYEIATKKGLNYVIDSRAGGVMYADESLNITQEVLDAVNTLWKAEEGKKEQPSKK